MYIVFYFHYTSELIKKSLFNCLEDSKSRSVSPFILEKINLKYLSNSAKYCILPFTNTHASMLYSIPSCPYSYNVLPLSKELLEHWKWISWDWNSFSGCCEALKIRRLEIVTATSQFSCICGGRYPSLFCILDPLQHSYSVKVLKYYVSQGSNVLPEIHLLWKYNKCIVC